MENIKPIPRLIEDLGITKGIRFGIFECPYCKGLWKTRTNSVNTGQTKSCGCHRELKSHQLRYTRLYKIWDSMRQRCHNKNNTSYMDYGGRGISICEEWKNNVVKFYEWAMTNGYQEGLSIDRIDVNGNYEPDNCRWATQSTQMRNTRDIIATNITGFRGVSIYSYNNTYTAMIKVNNKQIYLGRYETALEAGKAYERYVRLNNLEHNFTPALTEEEIKELEQDKVKKELSKHCL